MKKHAVTAIGILLALAGTAQAQTATAPGTLMENHASAGPQGPGHDWTLDEARQKAHEHADKLDKMTAQEWADHQQKRHAWLDKWKKMTPEEKKAWREKQHAKREAARNAASSGAAPAAATPPAAQ